MNFNKSNKENLEQLFTSLDESFDLDYETKMISYQFLSLVDQKMEELDLSKKEIAVRIGSSASYITQLFNGSKTLNLKTIAKFKNALDIDFKVIDRNSKLFIEREEKINYIDKHLMKNFILVYTNNNEFEYDKNDNIDLNSKPLSLAYAS